MSVDEMQQAFRLKVNDELTVTCFARGTSVLLFAVREWDAKVIRLPGSYNKSRGSSEQAMRASIRQAILNLKLESAKATKSEIRLLKNQGILGKRAPSCTLLSGAGMTRLMMIFGRDNIGSELQAAIANHVRKYPNGLPPDHELVITMPVIKPRPANHGRTPRRSTPSSPTLAARRPRRRSMPKKFHDELHLPPASKRQRGSYNATKHDSINGGRSGSYNERSDGGMDALLTALSGSLPAENENDGPSGNADDMNTSHNTNNGDDKVDDESVADGQAAMALSPSPSASPMPSAAASQLNRIRYPINSPASEQVVVLQGVQVCIKTLGSVRIEKEALLEQQLMLEQNEKAKLGYLERQAAAEAAEAQQQHGFNPTVAHLSSLDVGPSPFGAPPPFNLREHLPENHPLSLKKPPALDVPRAEALAASPLISIASATLASPQAGASSTGVAVSPAGNNSHSSGSSGSRGLVMPQSLDAAYSVVNMLAAKAPHMLDAQALIAAAIASSTNIKPMTSPPLPGGPVLGNLPPLATTPPPMSALLSNLSSLQPGPLAGLQPPAQTMVEVLSPRASALTGSAGTVDNLAHAQKQVAALGQQQQVLAQAESHTERLLALQRRQVAAAVAAGAGAGAGQVASPSGVGATSDLNQAALALSQAGAPFASALFGVTPQQQSGAQGQLLPIHQPSLTTLPTATATASASTQVDGVVIPAV